MALKKLTPRRLLLLRSETHAKTPRRQEIQDTKHRIRRGACSAASTGGPALPIWSSFGSTSSLLSLRLGVLACVLDRIRNSRQDAKAPRSTIYKGSHPQRRFSAPSAGVRLSRSGLFGSPLPSYLCVLASLREFLVLILRQAEPIPMGVFA